MNKIDRFLLIYMVVITTLCGYMCYVAFYREGYQPGKLVHQVDSTIIKEQTTKEQAETTKKEKRQPYGLALRDGSLVILNNQTKEIFEYTDLTKNDLPDEVHQMLKEKKKFHSVEEVYHFLESYSS